MPQFPPPALDDVEAQNQRAFAALGQRQMGTDSVIANQANQNFVTSNNLQNAAIASSLLGADSLNPQILGARSVQAQPQSTGSLIQPGVVSGTPESGNTSPAQPKA